MNKAVCISRDDNRNESFLADGFYTHPFLDNQETESLRQALQEFQCSDKTKPLYHSYVHEDTGASSTIHQIIYKFITPLIPRLNLADKYKIITAVYIDKAPSEKAGFDLHTDDSLCDERIQTQINIWIPLIDVNYKNGTMCISDKSHVNTPLIRGNSSGDPYIRKNQNILLKQYSAIEIPKGHVLVYNPSCIHFSPPNRSRENRPVVACVLIPEDAELCIFFKKKRIFGGNMLYKYILTFEQFIHKENLSRLTPAEKIKL